MTFTSMVKRMIDHAWSEPGASDPRIRRTLSKPAHARFLTSIGIAHAKIRAELPTEALLTEELLGPSAVVKPTAAAESRGVFLLERRDRRNWVEQKTGKAYSLPALRRAMREDYRPWIVEDLLSPPEGSPLMEYCVMCFGGSPRVAFGKSSSLPGSFQWVLPGWAPLDIKRPYRPNNRELQPPRYPEGVIQLAQTVSRSLRLPFARVDVFDTRWGLVVGELLAWSGDGKSPLWPPDWDKTLAQWWKASTPMWPYREKLWDT